MGSPRTGLVLGLALGLAIGLAAGWFLRGAGGARREPPAALSMEAGERTTPRSGGGALAPSAPEPEARGARSVAPEGEATPLASLSEERAAALAASVAPPRVEREQGELALWGRVTDGSDMGVAGVLVRATRSDPYSRTNGPSNIGRDAPVNADLDAALRESARNFAKLFARTFETRSDAQGAFRLDRLPPGRYLVEGYLRDAQVEMAVGVQREVPAGVEVDLVARPVFTVPVRVALADGSAPDSAVLSCKPSGDERRSIDCRWTPAEPELRLAAGTYEVAAVANLIDSGALRELTGELRSESQPLVLARGAPVPELEFLLTARPGVRGRVSFVKDGITGGRARILLLALGRDEALDSERLAESRTALSLRGDDDYAFLDLEPGRYALGVMRADEAPISVERVVEIAGGTERCDLDVPPLDLTQFLTVRVRGAAGEALDGVRFRFTHIQGGGSRSGGGLSDLRAEDGSYVVTIPTDSRPAYFGKADGHTFALSIETKAYGSRNFPLQPGQTELDASLAPAATLDVVVAGIASAADARRLRLRLVPASTAEDPNRYISRDVEVRADGSAHFDEHEAGTYELGLEVISAGETLWGQRASILTQPVELAAGANSARIAMPALYPLVVRWTGSEPAKNFTVRAGRIEEREQRASRSTRWANPDASGGARFDDLPGGTYVLSGWSESSGSIEKQIEVPCGEVSLGP